MTYCVLVSFSVEGTSPKLCCDFCPIEKFHWDGYTVVVNVEANVKINILGYI